MDNWLSRAAAATPERPAVIAADRELSYAELERLATETARRLATLGAGPDTRVALSLEASPEYVVLLHALMKLGAVAVPLDHRLTRREHEALLEAIDPQLVITDFEQVRGAPEADRQLGTGFRLGAIHSIVHTSGSTGMPKPVSLTYGNHLWNAIGSGARLGIDPGERWLCCLSLHHVGGLAIVLRSAIYGTTVVLERFDAQAVRDLVDSGQLTIASLVGTMLERLLEAGTRLERLRCVLLGGGPVPERLLTEALDAGAPLAPTYGLTEAASQVATLPPGEAGKRLGSAGPPILPCSVRIDGAGEILVRGATVSPDAAGEDGWLRTGDLGHLDESGHLFVHGRADDVIVTGGENVSPNEVEDVLRSHPDVLDAGVTRAESGEWQQAVVAAVVVREGASVSAEGLKTFCRQRLAGYKVPKGISFAGALPRDAQGKLRRAAIPGSR